jgi:short chain dehydrogenase
MYPALQFRPVGVTFAPNVDYMKPLVEATNDITVSIVFNNAGYMVTGFLDQTPIEKIMANIECNSLAAIRISHWFAQLWVSSGQKGCIVFTSSVAGFIPTPFAAMYASTKAFISQYAACLHIELQPTGIDVCAIHPSPVSSQFYTKLEHSVSMIEAAAKNAIAPDLITDDIFRSIGVCAYRDLGGKLCTMALRLTQLMLQSGELLFCCFKCTFSYFVGFSSVGLACFECFFVGSHPTATMTIARLGLGYQDWNVLSTV